MMPCVAVGIAAGLGLMMSLPGLKRRSLASYASVQALGNTLGAMAVIPTLVFVKVSEPGLLLGVTQALADGYIVGQVRRLDPLHSAPQGPCHPSLTGTF